MDIGGYDMTFTVYRHRLHENGNPVTFIQSPHGGGQIKPIFLVIHYTAGTTAAGAVNWFQAPAAKASAHLVVDRDGSVTQMMAFNRIAWHAGKSSWQGLDSLNGYAIGIEIANAGKLTRRADGSWVNWAGNRIADHEVVIARHKNETTETGWHTYTPEQLEAVVAIGSALQETYRFNDVLGHEDISPGRKVDPGPAFPMGSVQSKIIGRR